MKRIVFWSVVCAGIFWTIFHNQHFLLMWETLYYSDIDNARVTGSNTTRGYVLTDGNWIEFPLSHRTDRLKFVTHANISRQTENTPGTVYKYALEYEIMADGKDQPLHQDTYHHITRLTRYQNQQSGEVYSASLYLNSSTLPADGRVVLLNSLNWPKTLQPERIRIRLMQKDTGVVDILLQAYQTEQAPQSETLLSWQRLSPGRQEKLARGNIYPPDFLSDDEKSNLLNQRWRPIGPLGVSTVDYHVRRLYTLREYGEDPTLVNALSPLPSVDFQRVLTLLTGSANTDLRFTLRPLGENISSREDTLTINWFGSSIKQRRTERIRISTIQETIFENSFGQGLLELRTDHPYQIKTERRTGTDWEEWHPEPIYSRTNICDDGKPVTFDIAHLDNLATPLRITLRSPVRESDNDNDDLTCQFNTNESGGTLDFTAHPSLYDRMLEHGQETPVSDPVNFYWNIPPRTDSIRFTCSRPVLIAAATRPPDLPHLVRVPEDYDRESISDVNRRSVWFPMLPLNYQDLFRQQRSVLLKVQQRPPNDDPFLLAGNYVYESFRPASQWSGRFLLTPPDEEPEKRKPKPGMTFHPLSMGSSSETIWSASALQNIQPRLLFFQKENSTGMVTILINGKPYFSSELSGKNGQLRLPPLAVGSHTLYIAAPANVQLFINHLKRDESGHLLRFANRLTEKGLQFDYQKISRMAERVSFTFFAPPGSERYRLRVRLTGLPEGVSSAPHDQFTLTDRRFDIQASITDPVRILNLDNRHLGKGQPLFFPVGDDIPPGQYRIFIELEHGTEAFLIASRITPGKFSSRRVDKEQQVQEIKERLHEPKG